jgi:hypothetical protein
MPRFFIDELSERRAVLARHTSLRAVCLLGKDFSAAIRRRGMTERVKSKKGLIPFMPSGVFLVIL